MKGQLFLADAGKALKEFRTALAADIQNAHYSREVETGILQFVEDVVTKKVEIKAHPTKRLHAKIYIFLPEGFNEHKPGHVIKNQLLLFQDGKDSTLDVPNLQRFFADTLFRQPPERVPKGDEGLIPRRRLR